jgi:hypothetical protein
LKPKLIVFKFEPKNREKIRKPLKISKPNFYGRKHTKRDIHFKLEVMK